MCEKLYDIGNDDQLCLMALRFSDIELKLKKIGDKCCEGRQKLNYAKTKMIRRCSDIDRSLAVNGNFMEDLHSFIYLGFKISRNGCSDVLLK